MRVPRRRAVLAILAILAAALLLFALGLFPQDPLRRALEARLRASLGPGARVGRLQVFPARLRATVEDLVLETPTLRVEVPRARLELGMTTLTGGALSIRSLEVDVPRILLRASAPATPGAPAALTRPLLVGRLVVRDGQLTVEQADLGGPVRIHGLGVEGSIGSGSLDVRVAGGEWARPSPVALGPAHARLRVSPLLAVQLDSFDAGTARSRLHAEGSLGPLAAMRPDLRLEADLDMAELSAIAGQAVVSGRLGVEGRLASGPEGPQLLAELTPTGISAYGVSVDGGSVRVAHRGGETTVTPALELLGGKLSGEARLSARRTSGELHAAGLDVARLRVALAPTAPAAAGRVEARMKWSGDPDREVRLDLRVGGEVRTNMVRALRVGATAEGRAHPKSRRFDLDWRSSVEADGADGAMLAALRATAEGALSGGAALAWDGRASGTATLRTPAGARDVSLQAQATGGSSRLAGSAELQGLGGQVTVDAEAEGSAVRRLAVRATDLDLASAFPDTAGTGSFQLESSGPFDRLALRGSGRIDGLTWRKAALGPLELDLGGDSRSPEVHLRAPALQATAEARLTGPGTLSGRIDLSRTPLASFSSLSPTPVEGTLSGGVALHVPLENPRMMRAEGSVESADVVAMGVALRTAGPMKLAWAEGSLRIEDLALVGEGLRLQASGAVATSPGTESSLRASGSVDLARLPLPEAWRVAGQVDAEVTASGTSRHPDLTGAITLAAVTVSGPGLPPTSLAEGRIQLEGDSVLVPGLTATLAEGQATLAGRAPLASFLEALRRRKGALEPDEEASLRLSWSGIDAAVLLERLRPGGSSVSGSLSGEATLAGGIASLREARGAVSMPKTALLVEDLPVDVGPLAVELSEGVATLPATVVTAQGGSLTLSGSVDGAARRFDAVGAGQLDLRALTPLLGAARLSGTADLDVSGSGPFDAPLLRGTVGVAGAALRVRDVPQAVTDIRGRVVFDERTVRVEEASATLGGGPLALTGSASLGRGGLSDVDLSLTGKEMALRYPLGLRTRVDADLRLRGRLGALRLEGRVKARSGRYDLERVLRASLRGSPAVKPVPSPFLRTITLEVDVDVARPIVVKSSLTDVRVGGQLSLLGDLESPEPFGQLALEPGGKVFLQGRAFDVDRGLVIYEGTWDPALDVALLTRISEASSSLEYRVTVTASGTLASPSLGFDSSPPVSETEIRSLIATGRLGASSLDSSKSLAGDQAAMLLAGGLGEGLGLDPVPIQPQLLSREQEPGAKFVFGKRLTRQVSLAYSLSLNDPEDRFIQLTADPWRDVTGVVQARNDGTWAVGAGQRLEFGGPKRARSEGRRDRPKLAEVRLEGDLPLPEAEMRKVLGLDAGSRPTSWDLQERAEKLRQRLIDRGYLEAEVASRLEPPAAVFRVQGGPRYRWAVEGMTAPPSLEGVIRSAFFADEALELGRQRLLGELRSRGHLRAEVKARAEDEPAGRVLLFTAVPGPRYESAEARFPGATAIGEARLLEVAGGVQGLLGSEKGALDAIRAAYAEIHHLAAEAGPVNARAEGSRLLVEVPVREGPRALLVSVRVEDSTLAEEVTAGVLRLRAGAPFDESAVAEARQRLRDHYLGLGHPKVRVTPSASVVGSDVEVVYRVAEGPRLVVGSVEIIGASRTRRSLIMGKVELGPGDPLDLRKLVSTESKLRNLALFSRVATDYTEESPSTVRIEVEEQAPLAAGYQLRYNEEDGVSGEVEALARNLAGTGLTLGGRYRQGADVDEQRASLDLPSFFRGRFTAAGFRLFEELSGGTDLDGNPVTNRRTQRGFQVQQTFPLENRWNVLVGYRFKRVGTESPFLQEPIEDDIAALDLSVLRETRDNPLDSRRGRFWSFNVELSPKALGSDLTFVKGFAQAFFSRSFGPSLTWAQGYRLGLATGFNGQDLVSSERFNAGGANSLRGFETDSVGPRDAFGFPTGGQAVVILNQELRLHHESGLGAAFFYDGGNVYASVKDMSLDLRHVLGAGVRYTSPVGLLRLDLGFPLFREPGEKSYQLFFSFGQAF